MFECRKIYGNLLLLSVMLFALSATACPVKHSITGDAVCWQERSFHGIRWENNSSTVIYRGQQLTAVAGSEMYLLPIDGEIETLLHCVGVFDRQESFFYQFGTVAKPYASRAPPGSY